MITFITKKVHQVKEEPDVLTIKDQFTQEDLTFIKSLSNIGFDLETNDLDPFIGSILLLIIGNKEHQYVIDATSVDCEEVLLNIIHKEEWNQLRDGYYMIDENVHPVHNTLDFKKAEQDYSDNYRNFDTVVLGANLKFDTKFVKVKWGITLTKMFDVMIADQRILQGHEVSFSLAAITERRLKKIRNKDVRTEFIGANPSTFVFKNSHIQYGADDIADLFDIAKSQKEDIEKYNLSLLIYGIEFPLIRELADAELEGMSIHEGKWRENIAKNKEGKFKCECELDNELIRLRDILLKDEEKVYLSNGKFGRKRQKEVDHKKSTPNLFGEEFDEIEINATSKTKKKAKLKSPYLNYSSTTELLNIFGRLKQNAPTLDFKGQPGPYTIPRFVTRRGKDVIDKSLGRFTTGAKSMETYLIENPGSIMRGFIETLIKYREYTVKINTFGEEFLIKYKNRVTGKFHTIYRQCHAITGRLQSGDTKNGWYNSQNIPAEKDYRECFYSDEDDMDTSDLSGAEAVIMIDKAQDEKFYQIAIVNDDAHSPLATAVWRAIGRYRMEKQIEFGGFADDKEFADAKRLSEITISKKENKDIRTVFKNYTFAEVYGCGIKKCAKMLNITEEEAKITKKVMRQFIGKTIAMVERNEKFALNNGYVILNNRTNSRIWYPQVVDAKRNGSQIPSDIEHIVKNSARNSPIQGTQADMVKEMIVEIGREARRQRLPQRFNFKFLFQVHDEIGYKRNPTNELVEFIPDGSTTPEMVTIPQFINKMMCKVGNRYLSYIKITAETVTEKTWTK